MTEGFYRLWQEKRLDLTVENVAWKKRQLSPSACVRPLLIVSRACGFDVCRQQHVG